MKKLRGNSVVKVFTFIFLVFFAFSTLINGTGAVICLNEDFYTRNEASVQEEFYLNTAYNIADKISDGVYINSLGKVAFLPGNVDYETITSMVDFKITDKNSNQEIYRSFEKTREDYLISNTKYMEIHYSGYEYFDSGNYEDVEIEVFLKPFIYENFSKVTLEYLISLHKNRFQVLINSVISIVLTIVLFSFLNLSAGYKKGYNGVSTSILEKIPFDLFTLIIGAVEVLSAFVIIDLFENLTNYPTISLSFEPVTILLSAIILLLFICGSIFVIWSMSLSKRIKLGSTLKSCLIYKVIIFSVKLLKRIINVFKEIFKNIHFVWKTAIIIFAITLIELIILFSGYIEYCVLFWVLEKAIFTPIIIFIAILLNKLKKGGAALSNGDFNTKISTEYMFWDFKEHAENLNSLGDGVATAVNERMKSERFKTELITNVSHDIKTPLTSVINYVDLIKKENPKGEKIGEYLEVLERQSNRLKKLVEDLVEASKASSGSIAVELLPCDGNILLEQAAGEYEEKFQSAGLDLIIKKSDEPLMLMADSRHLGRVFDNLLNNIYKHAMPGSRVYLSLNRTEDKAEFCFKNISKYELDISADELTERFVRADKSRNTEGSGLGLSIAKSLTELQNGEFKIITDGDLFKAILLFKLI